MQMQKLDRDSHEASGSSSISTEERPAPTAEDQIKAAKLMGFAGFILFAGFLLTIGYSIYQNSKTNSVDGIVVESIASHVESDTELWRRKAHESDRYMRYHHKFKYVDNEGIEHIARTTGEARDIAFSEGAVVSIGYYPDNPNKVRVLSWFGLWKVQLFLFLLGLTLIAYSIWSIKQIKLETN